MENLSPSERVLAKCGGAQIVAEWIGAAPSSVYKWTYPASRGGTGGTIPAKWHQTILDRALAAGIDLQPSDFFRMPGLLQKHGAAA